MVFTVSAGNSGDPCEHEHYDLQLSGVLATDLGLPAIYGDGEFLAFPDKQSLVLNEFILPPGESVTIDLLWNEFGSAPPDDLDLLLYCDVGGNGLDPSDLVGDLQTTSTDLQCG